MELRFYCSGDRPAELMMLERLRGVCCDKGIVINNVFKRRTKVFPWDLVTSSTMYSSGESDGQLWKMYVFVSYSEILLKVDEK